MRQCPEHSSALRAPAASRRTWRAVASRMARSRLVRRVALGGVVLLVVAVAAWLGVGAVAADRLTVPARYVDPAVTPGAVGATFADVVLTTDDGLDLAAWYLPVPGSDAAVVIVHGYNASRTAQFGGHLPELAASLQANGYHVVAMDLRGHGASAGARFSFGQAERRDVRAAVDFLVAQGVPEGQVGVLGASMGAAAAIGAAAEDARIGAVWADSAYAEILPVLAGRWSATSGLPGTFLTAALWVHRARFGVDLTASRPILELPRVAPRPIQLVHATADDWVPYPHALALRTAVPSAGLWTVPDVGHAKAYEADPDLYVQQLVEFFDAGLRTQVAGVR